VRLRSPWDREILRLAVPAFGALVAEPLYVLVDTAVVGHLGTPELAGVAIASSILLSAYALCIFLAYGTTASVARLLGAGEDRAAAHEAVQGLWLALLLGTALALLGFAFGPALVSLLGGEGEVAEHALLYLRISLFGLPALLAVLAGTGYLRGLQDTRTPLVIAIATATANLVAEVVLIYGFGFGVGASALTTVAVQWAAAAVYTRAIVRPARRLAVALAPDGPSLRRLLVVAGTLVVRTSALRSALVLATAVAARIGTTEVAAHQIAFEIWSALALALDALAIAAQAMVGRHLGASDAPSARAAGNRILELGVAAGVVAGLAIAAVHDVLPDLFTDDPDVAHLTAFVLWYVAALQPLNGLVFALDGLLIGAGDMRFLAEAMAAAAVVFAVAAGVVLATGAGLGWLWVAIGVFMAARAVPLLARWRGTAWAIEGATLARRLQKPIVQ
jgi:putative MATE family efflux protein